MILFGTVRECFMLRKNTETLQVIITDNEVKLKLVLIYIK